VQHNVPTAAPFFVTVRMRLLTANGAFGLGRRC